MAHGEGVAHDDARRGGHQGLHGRPAFPIDTHVHRVATRLGWIPVNTTADKAHRLLAPRVPPGIRYDLHIAMITHGRTFCRAQRPRCDVCVLRDLCAYGSAAGNVRIGQQRTR